MLQDSVAGACVTPAQIRLEAELFRSHTALSSASPTTTGMGTVLIQKDLLLPDGLLPQADPYAMDWSAVRGFDGFALDRRIRSHGWNFFLIAGDIKAIALGSEGNKTIRKAVTRLLAVVRSRRFNAAEVTTIVSARFLAIPYTTVTVHARHIQLSNVLQDTAARGKEQSLAAWAGGQAVNLTRGLREFKEKQYVRAEW